VSAQRDDRQPGDATGESGPEGDLLSGWQVAADANVAGEMYRPVLYPVNSVPAVVRRINGTFMRADQIQHMEGNSDIDFCADRRRRRAGFGGVLNASS
jgi:isocitrate lyase